MSEMLDETVAKQFNFHRARCDCCGDVAQVAKLPSTDEYLCANCIDKIAKAREKKG